MGAAGVGSWRPAVSNTAFGPDFGGGKLPSPRKAARERLPLALYLAVQRIADRELGTLLSQAASEAERVVLAHAGQNIGAKVRRAQLALVMAELRAEQVRLWSQDGPISDSVRRQMEEAAAAAAQAHNLLTRVLWNATDQGAPAGLESGLVQTARRGIQSIISRTQFRHELSAQVYRTGRATQARIGRLVDQALGRGASWKELAQDVKRFIDPRTPGGASYAAKRLARTEINNAFHTTQVRLAVESPFVTGLKWHLSGRHVVPDECNDLDGEVFAPERVPPKPHAQCICFCTPRTVETDEFVDRFLAGQYDDYVRKVQATYDPTPARKPAAEQPPKPEPKKRAPAKQKPLSITAQNKQILEQLKAAGHDERDLEIARLALLGNTRRTIEKKVGHNYPGVTPNFVTKRINEMDLPYQDRIKAPKVKVTTVVHEQHQRDVKARLDQFGNEFPEVTAELGGVRAVHAEDYDKNRAKQYGTNNTYAYYTPGDPVIYLNEHYFRDISPDALTSKTSNDVSIGFHPHNCTHSSSIFEHEFGHHVDNYLSPLQRQEMFVELANALNRSSGRSSYTIDQYKGQWTAINRGSRTPQTFTSWMFTTWLQAMVKAKVSRYAAKTDAEMVAELFAESRNRNPSEYARIVARHIDQAHGRASLPGRKQVQA